MKFEIIQSPILKKPEPEPIMKIWLEYCGDTITVKAESDDGKSYYILGLTHDGYYYRPENIPEELGLNLNKKGQILER